MDCFNWYWFVSRANKEKYNKTNSVTFKNASKSWNINAVFEGIGQKTDQDKLAL